jgi:hypothetical protein
MAFAKGRSLVSVGMTALLAPPIAAAQIPSAIEARIPKSPTVAVTDSGTFAVYEIHVTNLTPTPTTLRRVDVLDGTNVLFSLADSALGVVTSHPGVARQDSVMKRGRIGAGLRAYVYMWLPIDRERPPARLTHRFTFQKDTVTEVVVGSVTALAPAAVRIGAPFHGEWAALNGPSNASGHRRLVLGLNGGTAIGQRFAIDYLKIDSTGSSRRPGSDPSKNASYYAYGTELLAVADGIVAATKDSIPENVVGGRAVKIDMVTVGGNHVALDIGNGNYALYAHVQPGSLRVKVGDRVKRGQVLALLGNSGNSTEPHVHFQIADGPTFLSSEGVPYAVDFEVLGNCGVGGNPPKITCTRHAPTAVKGGIPMQNEVVRFP